MTANGDTSRVDLREAGICKRRASRFVGTPNQRLLLFLAFIKKIKTNSHGHRRQHNSILYVDSISVGAVIPLA